MADVGDVVRAWDAAVVAAARDDEAVRSAGTVLRAPAAESDVVALEQRIGHTLPPSYRSFLLTSDGADAQPGWGPTDRGLLRAAEVGWFNDLEPEWVEAYLIDGLDEVAGDRWEERLPHTLMVAADEQGQTVLLDPLTVDGSGEWAAWFFGNHIPGAEIEPSFAALLVADTASYERHPDQSDEARAALAAASDPTADEQTRAQGLRRLPFYADAADHLDLFLLTAADRRLPTAVRQAALDALGKVDHLAHPEAVGTLVAALRDPEARVRGSAVPPLAHSADPGARAAAVQAIADPATPDFAVSYVQLPAGIPVLLEAWALSRRTAVLAQLMSLGVTDIVDDAAAALADPALSGEQRTSILIYAYRLDDRRMVDALLAAHRLGDVLPAHVARSLQALGAVDEAAGVAIESLGDDPGGMLAGLLGELARAGQPDAVRALVSAFRDKPTAAGAKALGAVDDADARAALVAQAGQPRLAKAVVTALERMPGEPARAALADLVAGGGPAAAPAAAALDRRERSGR
ncbi:MAG TPA: SMI1/KNR4 family protein [Actinomycetes bacterium]|nr:SMI1/KNR4 family protein [Actinomycetes bacterium]